MKKEAYHLLCVYIFSNRNDNDEALHSIFLFISGIDMLEGQVKESKTMVEQSEIQYDESARKLAMVEGDLQRGDERAESGG